MEIGENRNRIYVGIALIALILVVLWYYFVPAATHVETAKAVRAELLDTIDVEGYTRVKNKFTVTAPVSGKLARIKVREGDNILKNFPLAEVDPNPPIPRSPNLFDDRPNPYAAKVFAPASGRILRIFEKSERFLEVGTPLLEIGDPANIEIVADVLSTDAVRIPANARVLIDNNESGVPIGARVRLIEPQAVTKVSALGVEEKRVDVIADFIEGKPTFGDNFRLDVRIVVWRGEDVLTVPNSALFRTGDQWNLFVVENGRASLRTVKTGHRSRTDTQILEGLNENDTVVIHPPNTLEDSQRVTDR